MAVVKEWFCQECNHEFDSAIDLCPRCYRSARRAYRTAPGSITKGLVRRVDGMLAAELADRGLSDIPKPRDYSDAEAINQFVPGSFDRCSGSGQIPISPGWGKGALNKTNETFGTHFEGPSAPGNSYTVPDQSAVGPSRDYVRTRTHVVARIDDKGNRIG